MNQYELSVKDPLQQQLNLICLKGNFSQYNTTSFHIDIIPLYIFKRYIFKMRIFHMTLGESLMKTPLLHGTA